VQIPITMLVQGWVADAESNRGLLLRAEGATTNEYYLASSEWRKNEVRPRVRVRLAGQVVSASMARPLSTVRPGVEPAFVPAARPADEVLAQIAEVVPAGLDCSRTLAEPVAAATSDTSCADTAHASLLDVTVYLYAPDGGSLPCEVTPIVQLWGAPGVGPARLMGVATRKLVTRQALTFPVWQFSNIDRPAAQGTAPQLHLFAIVQGMRTTHNMVTIGEESGTVSPTPALPEGKAPAEQANAVDASIEIVWPQGDAPVTEARLANLTVALFSRGTRKVFSSDQDFQPRVRLHWSLNDGVDRAPVEPPVAIRRLLQSPWSSYYLWDFNDVDVSLGRAPGNYINFWVEVEGIDYRTNVWSHGFGPRPMPQAPLPNMSCRQEG
jgi:hypothetical protein